MTDGQLAWLGLAVITAALMSADLAVRHVFRAWRARRYREAPQRPQEARQPRPRPSASPPYDWAQDGWYRQAVQVRKLGRRW